MGKFNKTLLKKKEVYKVRIWLFITLSFIAHFIIFGTIYFFNFSKVDILTPKIDKKISSIKKKKLFIRVDVVSMPKISMNELKKLKASKKQKRLIKKAKVLKIKPKYSKKKLSRPKTVKAPSSKKLIKTVKVLKKKLSSPKVVRTPSSQKLIKKIKDLKRPKNNVIPEKMVVQKLVEMPITKKKVNLRPTQLKKSNISKNLEIGKKKVISLQNPIVKKFKKKEKSVLKTIPNKENKKVSTLKVPIVKKLGKKVTAEKSVLNKVSLKTSQLMERLKSYKVSKELNTENKKTSTRKDPIVKKITVEKSVLNKVSLKASQLLERLKSYKFNKKRPAISKQEKIKPVKVPIVEKLPLQKKEVPPKLVTKIKREPKSESKIIVKEKENVLDLIKKLGTKKVKTLSYAKRKKLKRTRIGIKNEKIIKNLLIEGNKISKGDNLTDGETLSKEEEIRKAFENYAERLRSSVKNFWKLPEYLKGDSNLRCRIQIFISSEGKLLNIDIYESSGNKEYDKRAVQTVKITAPFPPAEKNIEDRLLNGDLILGFPL